MLIKVQRKHIRKGVRGKCKTCPIALAISEALTEKFNYEAITVVSSTSILMNVPYKFYQFWGPIPVEITEKIKQFDATGQMSPFSFELELSDVFNRSC